MNKRTCAQCHQPIPAERTARAKFCTIKCSKAAHRTSKKICSEPVCERNVLAKGLCSTHYNRTQPNRHSKKLVKCAWCGTEVAKQSGGGRKYGQTCSNECRSYLTHPYCKLPADHWALWFGKVSKWKEPVLTMTIEERGRSQRSGIRAAIEDDLGPSFLIAAIKDSSAINDAGCWTYSKPGKDGYPIYTMALKTGKRKSYRLHRLVLEAKLGKQLGSQAAHHMCANSSCVNPEHLQPISFRENTAEMMQRNYYVTRIRELEVALAALSPDHSLLNEIGLPSAA